MTNTYTNASNARRAAKAAGIPTQYVTVTQDSDGKFAYAETMFMVSCNDEDMGILPAREAVAAAQEAANENQCEAYLRDHTTDEVMETITPEKPKGAPKKDGPSGMVATIIELALRPQGVTSAELNETTKWKGAPWKWLFSNPKQTGYADRWGYDLDVSKNGRAAVYKLTHKNRESLAA